MPPKDPFRQLPPPADYEVGYRKPPAETRFKLGQSGNPRGRPTGKMASQGYKLEDPLQYIVEKEAYRRVTVNDGNKQTDMTMIEAVVRALGVAAGKGNVRAQKIFTELVARTETAKRAKRDQELEVVFEYKATWERELERREALGIDGPEPLPHPDDIHINFLTGEWMIRGPIKKKELAELKLLISAKETYEKNVGELVTLFRAASNKKEKSKIRPELHQSLLDLQQVEDAIEMRASPECVARISRSK